MFSYQEPKKKKKILYKYWITIWGKIIYKIYEMHSETENMNKTWYQSIHTRIYIKYNQK
jgi:hypothetical protein